MYLSRGLYAQGRRRGPVTVLVLALAAAAVIGGPALAAQPPWYGSSVRCYYEADMTGERLLAGIVVTPPDLYALDEGTQTVGWRFVVRRSRNWDVGPWKITYRSPIQKAEATVDQPAAFAAMSVGVRIPDVEDKSAIRYRVMLKMLWYLPDGSVSSRVRHRMLNLKWYANGNLQGGADYCPASLDTGL